MRKKILYIIDSLERGGAEIMLVSPLAEIQKHYDIIIVTLKPENVFTEEELVCEKRYCLQMNSRKEIFKAEINSRKLFRKTKLRLCIHSFIGAVLSLGLPVEKKCLTYLAWQL